MACLECKWCSEAVAAWAINQSGIDAGDYGDAKLRSGSSSGPWPDHWQATSAWQGGKPKYSRLAFTSVTFLVSID